MSIEIATVVPEEVSTLDHDAVVLEDDTFLVLSADPTPKATPERPVYLLKQAMQVEPEVPGTVIAKEKAPLRLLAVVHDLNQDPSWQEEWISSALVEALRAVEKRKLGSMALQMLGTVHGSLDPARFLKLLEHALATVRCEHLEKIWVVVPGGVGVEVRDQLSAMSCQL